MTCVSVLEEMGETAAAAVPVSRAGAPNVLTATVAMVVMEPKEATVAPVAMPASYAFAGGA